MLIHKAICLDPRSTIVPGYPLSAGFQGNEVYVWYRTAPVEWEVRLLMTGEDFELDGSEGYYLNTLQRETSQGGYFVLHAFQKSVRPTTPITGGL